MEGSAVGNNWTNGVNQVVAFNGIGYLDRAAVAD